MTKKKKDLSQENLDVVENTKNTENIKVKRVRKKKTVEDNTNETSETKKEVKHKRTSTVDDVVQSIKSARAYFDYSSSHLTIVLYGAKMLGNNQMLALAQQKPMPFNLVKYKNTCHQKFEEIIKEIIEYSVVNNKPLPNFNDLDDENNSVRLSLYKQSLRTYDQDNIFGGFKYFIDALRNDVFVEKLNITNRILMDDNQTYITQIEPYQKKIKKTDEHIIAIKIQKYHKDHFVNNIDDFIKQS